MESFEDTVLSRRSATIHARAIIRRMYEGKTLTQAKVFTMLNRGNISNPRHKYVAKQTEIFFERA